MFAVRGCGSFAVVVLDSPISPALGRIGATVLVALAVSQGCGEEKLAPDLPVAGQAGAGAPGEGGMAGASATGGSGGESGASGLAGAGGGSTGGGAGSQNGGAGGGGAGGCDGGQQLCQGVCSPPGDKLCSGLAVSFSEPTLLPFNGRADSVAFADFDSNGVPDIVVSWTYKTTTGPGGKCGIVVYPGAVGGQYGLTTSALDICAGDVAAGDVNGDGHNDVVFSGGDGLRYFAGNGDGSFKAHVELTSKHPQLSIVAGDVDGDGSLDIVGIPTTASDGLVRFFSRDGTGAFTPKPNIMSGFASPARVLLRRTPGKSALGVVVVGPDSSVRLFPDGGFGKASFASGGLSNQLRPKAAIASLGNDDVVAVTATFAHTLLLYPLQGDVLSAPSSIKLGNGPFGVSAADVNADGRHDLVVITSQIELWTGDGKGNFANTFNTSFADGFMDVTATDLNGDKLPDLIVWGSNFVRIFMNTSK